MNVYVCVTLYHVYIALLKIFSYKENKKAIVILLNANNEHVYNQFVYIYNQLLKLGFNCAIRLRTKRNEFLGRENKFNRQQLTFVEKQMEEIHAKHFTLYNFAWNNSYVYSTASMLYKKCKDAVFIEESTLIAKVPIEKKWKTLLHKYIYGGVNYIKDDKLKEILVQKPELFPQEWQSKIRPLQISSMIGLLTEEDKLDILRIMSKHGERLQGMLGETGLGIIYSNPFSEDGLISESEKINNLIKICNLYKKYGRVILKLHPRDTSVYPVGEEITVLPGSFPSELLSLLGCKFKYAVAVSSSAVDTTNADYKINMNDNYLHDKIFVLKDINGNIVEN